MAVLNRINYMKLITLVLYYSRLLFNISQEYRTNLLKLFKITMFQYKIKFQLNLKITAAI